MPMIKWWNTKQPTTLGNTSADLLPVHIPTPSITSNMGDSMTLDQQAAFLAVFAEVAGGAKLVRYVNLASVSRQLSTNRSSFRYSTVAVLYLRLDPHPGSRGEKLLTF